MISFLLSVRPFFRFSLVVIYLLFILALSLLPPQDLPEIQLFNGADKVVHFMMYLIFSVLGCWALKAEENRTGIWLTIPLAIGWGILMELIQLEMRAGRSFSWYDIQANTAGVAVGILIYTFASRKFVP